METPLERLKKMTAWESEPALTENELDDLLETARMIDESGTEPNDDSWEPTFNFNAAAASAWLIKAGRASSLVEIDPPDPGIAASKIFDNCISMAEAFTRKKQTSVSTR